MGKPREWVAAKSVAANGRRVLPRLTKKYLRAGKRLMDKDPSLKELHSFRLKTKRLRYTLELFRPCYGASLEPRLEALRRIQQYLGTINDCGTTRRLVLGTRRPRGGNMARLAKSLDARVAENTQRLLRDLRRNLRGSERKAWWVEYLDAAGGSAAKKEPTRARQPSRAVTSDTALARLASPSPQGSPWKQSPLQPCGRSAKLHQDLTVASSSGNKRKAS